MVKVSNWRGKIGEGGRGGGKKYGGEGRRCTAGYLGEVVINKIMKTVSGCLSLNGIVFGGF